MQTREERIQTAGPTFPQGLAGDGLHHGKGVLDAVRTLAEQKFLGLLSLQALLFSPQSLKAKPELPGPRQATNLMTPASSKTRTDARSQPSARTMVSSAAS